MLTLRRPADDRIRPFLEACRDRAFSYPEVGQTRALPFETGAGTAPDGYVLDHNRAPLGTGEAAFGRAHAALRRWAMFDVGWASVYPAGTPIEKGTMVGIVAQGAGLWSVNPTRIVYTFETEEPAPATAGVAKAGVKRFGFGYGTIEGHAACGEERFAVEWRRDDDEVWFDVVAFSRPSAWYVRLGYPYLRHLQRRFGADAKAAMRRAVGE